MSNEMDSHNLTHMAHLIASAGRTTHEADSPESDELARQVSDLTAALKDPDRHVRWQAARTLSETPVVTAAPALVEAMNDEDFGVVWLAAEALTKLGSAALEPLLQAMVEGHETLWCRQGAYRIIRALVDTVSRPDLKPVLHALESAEPDVTTPVAAHEALWEMHQ